MTGPFTGFDGMYSTLVGLQSQSVSAPHSPYSNNFPSLLRDDTAYVSQGQELSAAFRALRDKDAGASQYPSELDSYIQTSLHDYDLASVQVYRDFGIAPSDTSSTASSRATSPQSSPARSTFALDKLDVMIAAPEPQHISSVGAMLNQLNTQDGMSSPAYLSPTLRASLPLFIQPDNNMYAGSPHGYDIEDEDRKPEAFIL